MSLAVEIDHIHGSFRLEASFAAAGGLTALFGPSGSGKTTLVNAIAGLLRPRRGRIAVDGATLLDTQTGLFVPAHRRRVGYVFQEGRLFPHLSVRGNLMFGRWIAGRSKADAGNDLDRVTRLLDIAPLLERRTQGLSGGEKQRVAIGRALLARPRLLLMDEPLASLDAQRKAEILPYLERLRDAGDVPIVYVSHALSEVARLATTIVVIEAGRVTAAGAAADILGRLDVQAIQEGGEGGAVIAATVTGHEEADGLTVLTTPAGQIRVPRLSAASGSRIAIRIRARDVMLSLHPLAGVSALNILPGRVAGIDDPPGSPDGSVVVRVDCGGSIIPARITRRSRTALGLQPGLALYAVVKAVSVDGGSPPPAPAQTGVRDVARDQRWRG